MSNTTVIPEGTGPDLIQREDVFQAASILHPLVIGTCILLILFVYLRMSSNRSVAPMTLFDNIVSVAMGSTLAGVVNGTPLVRGIIALAVLFFWQYSTSWVTMKWPKPYGRWLSSPALIVAYRGRALRKVMRAHRVSHLDLNSALRTAGVWNIKEVEVVAIEPNGNFTVFLQRDYPTDYEPDVLWEMDGYRALREHDEKCQNTEKRDSRGNDGEDAAMDTC